ncbi:MAG: sulfotransferase [Coleofasciculus sp. C1-SOL-03]|uniref:sulfotransferase n=1 Tax=Coleofasciculus sp. C1-SOL-03 TaxID=3069522 RepID=UPI00330254C8
MGSIEINKTADESYLNLLPNIDISPIFIMGDHRSGTTLLYKLLVATQCFNFVKAYHVIKYEEILSNYLNQTENKVIKELEQLLRSLNINNRVIDNVEATPDLPEEYGFILKNRGYELYLNSDNLFLFIELCKKIQFISNLDRPLLVKNPWCFPHFIYVKKVSPKSKFIFIHRHPIHVINSKLKATRSILAAKNPYIALLSQMYTQIFKKPVQRFFYQALYSSYFNLGLRRVIQQSVQSTTYFLQNVDSLPNTDYVSVKYEDICHHPKATIFSILQFLGLQSKADLAYETLIEPRSLNLLPEVQRKYKHICQELKPYLSYHGYDTEGDV